jgi:hypothetical protein
MVSFTKLLTIGAVALAATAATADTRVLKHTTAQGFEIEVIRLADTPSKAIAPKADYALCNVCVQFMMATLNYLANYILNAGVIGGCDELCELGLKGKPALEQDVCIALCDAAGLGTFIEALEKEDPDPIPVCETIELCEYVPGGNVKMYNFAASPSTVPLGSETVLTAEFTVVNRTSTGEIRFQITPKGGSGTDADGVALPTPPGNYRANCKVPTGPGQNGQQGPVSAPGVVDAGFFLCEGQCGDTKWKHSHTYASATTNFTVVPK